MQDAGVALRLLLLSDPDVEYLTGGRVYVEDIPDGEIANMPRGCVVLRASGGLEQSDFGPVSIPRYDIWSYGESRYKAGQVDRAVWDYLHYLDNQNANDTLIHSVVLSGGPRAAKEPDTGWPVQIRSCTVRYNTDIIS